jgi:hypothetical protein
LDAAQAAYVVSQTNPDPEVSFGAGFGFALWCIGGSVVVLIIVILTILANGRVPGA